MYNLEGIPINRPESQRYNVTYMLEDCCANTQNQCDCFFRFGEPNTPFFGICEAVLINDYNDVNKFISCISDAMRFCFKLI